MSTRPYFRYSLAATAWTAGLPAAALFVAFAILRPSPSALVSAGIAAAAFLIASAIGAWGWARFHASARLTFPELMIWAWAKRSWAERSLARGASLLGVDERGFLSTPASSSLSAQRQLRALRRLNIALERKDPYTHGHSSRVERYCTRIAADLGLDQDRLSKLRRASVLHDVGKMRVPDRILRKAGVLTPDERAVVEEHVVLGARLVSRLGSAEVTDAVLHHHERWDGRGYPHGLVGERIPLYARIIAVVDAYDAMTSTRPYRTGLSSARAVEILWEEAGRQFDAEVVKHFVRAIEARAPVAALAPFAIGLHHLVREASRLFRQPATAGVAPAAGAMVAVTLVVGTLLPAGPAALDPHSSAQAQTPGSSGSVTAMYAPGNAPVERAKPLQEHEGTRAESEADEPKADHGRKLGVDDDQGEDSDDQGEDSDDQGEDSDDQGEDSGDQSEDSDDQSEDSGDQGEDSGDQGEDSGDDDQGDDSDNDQGDDDQGEDSGGEDGGGVDGD
ncbi:MAG: HD domain-containing phosphohydrolase [Actinomycetota bacterium]